MPCYCYLPGLLEARFPFLLRGILSSALIRSTTKLAAVS